MTDWLPIESAPSATVVETVVLDKNGNETNHNKLIKQGKLWFFPDFSMYVYYTPTHWRIKAKKK